LLVISGKILSKLSRKELMNVNGGEIDWDELVIGGVIQYIAEKGLSKAIALYGGGPVGAAIATAGLIMYGVYKSAEHDNYEGDCVNEYGHQQFAN